MARPPYYLTAYALAVKHGFKGTEEEWLESLHGAGGARGPEGPQGPQGPQGTPGEPGTLIIHTQGNEAELAPVGVLAAVEKGQNVVLLYGDLRLTLVHADENSAVFTAVAGGQMTAKVVMDADGWLSPQTFQLASKEDAKTLRVNVSITDYAEDDTCFGLADKTPAEIAAAVNSGRSVCAVDDEGIIYSLVQSDSEIAIFLMNLADVVYVLSVFEAGVMREEYPLVTLEQIPSKTSQLTNDSGFITGYTETDPTVPSWAKQANKPSYTASEVGALPNTTKIPSKTSDLTNDSGYITGYTETDPTVPAWAKAASKPSYSKSEVGLGNVDNVKQYSASNPPPYPVTSVNGKTGAVTITVPTVPTKVSAFENDKGYLTQHQDISGKLDTSALPTAINTALEQAKDSGEFDGEDGQRGTGLLSVTTAPSSYTTAVGGITPKYRMALSTIKTQAGVTEVLLGDTVRYSYYHYPIDYLDASYAYFTERVSVRGATGAAGKDGADGQPGVPGADGNDGYTPVRGVDYWTEADKAEIVAMVLNSLGGNPVFGYVDEDNNIIVSGNLPDGTYSVKYEMEDGATVNIGNLVLDTNVYYTVTNALTNCTNSNSAAQAAQGGSYSATITAKSGYELSSVMVTMGGTDISSTAVSGGKITIANVTGDIVITATATEIQTEPAEPTNFAEPNTTNKTDWSIWCNDARFGSDGGYRALTGNVVTNYVPMEVGDIIRFEGLNVATTGTSMNNGMHFSDTNKAMLTCSYLSFFTDEHYNYLTVTVDNSVYEIDTAGLVKHAKAGASKYFRISGALTGTVNDVVINVKRNGAWL